MELVKIEAATDVELFGTWVTLLTHLRLPDSNPSPGPAVLVAVSCHFLVR
jgi:hypothetical protein